MVYFSLTLNSNYDTFSRLTNLRCILNSLGVKNYILSFIFYIYILTPLGGTTGLFKGKKCVKFK